MAKKLTIVVVCLIVLGGLGYFVFFKQEQSDTSSFSPSKTVKEVLGIKPSTENWQTYRHKWVGFSIKYPEGYTVEEQAPSSSPVGEVFQVMFLPDPKDKPDLWKSVPLSVLVAPDAAYAEIQKEFERVKIGAEYYRETPKTIAGIDGLEVKIGPSPNVGNNQHSIYAVISHKNGHIVFISFAKDKNQLEKEAIPLFDAFLSTLKLE